METTVIFEMESPFRAPFQLKRLTFGSGSPVVAIVAGLHGNELNGIYSLNLLSTALSMQKLEGTVHIFPLINSFGTDQCQKEWPFEVEDINKSFPGDPSGSPAQRIAHHVLEATKEATFCVDVHSGASHIRELPQVRCRPLGRDLLLGRSMQLPVLWRRNKLGSPDSLLGAWQLRGQTALHLIGGRGTTLDSKLATRMAAGLVNLLAHLNIIRSSSPSQTTMEIENANVQSIRADCGGFFIPEVRVGDTIEKGVVLGVITSPIGGAKLSEYRAEHEGLILSVRANPMIHSQELLIRYAKMSSVQNAKSS